jgi:hypothetical protein
MNKYPEYSDTGKLGAIRDRCINAIAALRRAGAVEDLTSIPPINDALVKIGIMKDDKTISNECAVVPKPSEISSGKYDVYLNLIEETYSELSKEIEDAFGTEELMKVPAVLYTMHEVQRYYLSIFEAVNLRKLVIKRYGAASKRESIVPSAPKPEKPVSANTKAKRAERAAAKKAAKVTAATDAAPAEESSAPAEVPADTPSE